MIDLSGCKGQSYAVMGLARSGLVAARALLAGGALVLAWDDGEAGRAAATHAGIPLTDLHHADFSNVSALILSPGIPHTFPAPNPVAARAKAAGVPIIGDIELLKRARPDATYLCITGTNGKSTTTSLVGHILTEAGRATQIGGNLGIPALSFAPLGKGGIYVLEMSSYQLELSPSLGFDAAVLLNITPDHLDRHGGMDGYVAAKRLAFRPGATAPVAIIGGDDDYCRQMATSLAAEGRSSLVQISAERVISGGVFAPDGILIDDTGGAAQAIIDLRTCPTLPGRHNWQNACAAYALARSVGVAATIIAAALRSFPGLAHRQQMVATIDGVRFVNDSKATNADATAKALACSDAIHWILGGKAKEGGLDGLEPFMDRVRRAYLIGAATEEFAVWLTRNQVSFERCGTLDRATAAAFATARHEQGTMVLLSPACASFDQFANFEVRGDAFMASVHALATSAGGSGS